MNPEICKNCKLRTLVFEKHNEQVVCHEREQFVCCSNKHDFKFNFDFGFNNIETYLLKNKKWKRFNWRLLQDINFKFNKDKFIDDIMKKVPVDDLLYHGVEDKNFITCPYYLEHQIYDWNKKK